MILDKLENKHIYSNISKRLVEAFEFIENTDFSNFKLGRTDIKGDELFVLVNEYRTKKNDLNILEAHKKYIDLQYIISGTEIIEYESFEGHLVSEEYVDVDDYSLFHSKAPMHLKLTEGSFAIFYPGDLHLPGIALNNEAMTIKKVVFKILID